MIVFFGPAGSGKSMQGQMLAARQGWRWLSAGQLLRDTRDSAILDKLHSGNLIDNSTINKIISDSLARAENIDQVILDGYPRLLEQAEWLVASQPQHGRSIGLAIVLDVPRDDLLKRLEVRGRADDTIDVIEKRFEMYEQEVAPILNYLSDQNITVVHIDGSGSVGQVHDKIMEELVAHKLV